MIVYRGYTCSDDCVPGVFSCFRSYSCEVRLNHVWGRGSGKAARSCWPFVLSQAALIRLPQQQLLDFHHELLRDVRSIFYVTFLLVAPHGLNRASYVTRPLVLPQTKNKLSHIKPSCVTFSPFRSHCWFTVLPCLTMFQNNCFVFTNF